MLSLKHLVQTLNDIAPNQEQSVNAISLTIYKYFLRCVGNETGTLDAKTLSNLLLIGETGSGKTFLVKKACELISQPLLEVNSADLSSGGSWSGTSLTQLISKSGYHHGIIFIDEIDKIMKPALSDSGDVNRRTQENLLKIIEGYDLNGILTSNFCFILAGSFTDMLHKKETPEIGFIEKKESSNIYEGINDKLLNYGMIPEFLGRIGNITFMNSLTRKSIENLLDSRELDFNKWVSYLFKLGIKPPIIDRQGIIERVLGYKLGIRGLTKELDLVLDNLIQSNIDKIDIDAIIERQAGGTTNAI